VVVWLQRLQARVCGLSLQPIGGTSALACDIQRRCSRSCRLCHAFALPFNGSSCSKVITAHLSKDPSTERLRSLKIAVSTEAASSPTSVAGNSNFGPNSGLSTTSFKRNTPKHSKPRCNHSPSERDFRSAFGRTTLVMF